MDRFWNDTEEQHPGRGLGVLAGGELTVSQQRPQNTWHTWLPLLKDILERTSFKDVVNQDVDIYVRVFFANVAKNSRSVYPTAELSSPAASGAASQPLAIAPSSK